MNDHDPGTQVQVALNTKIQCGNYFMMSLQQENKASYKSRLFLQTALESIRKVGVAELGDCLATDSATVQ